MKLPVVKERRTNKILCLVFLGMAAVFLLVGGGYALAREPVLAQVMCFLAAIVGGFSALYGVFWLIYRRKEQKRQKKLERAAQLLAEPDEGYVDYREFVLPREALTEAARLRFRKFAVAMAATAAAVFVVLYGVLLVTNGFGGFGHLLLVAIFCLLMTLPGLVIQYGIYRKYAKSVPGRILLFPGQLIVDGRQFRAREIEKLTISSYKSANRNTTALYRKLTVKTEDQAAEYTIDYRGAAGENPRWEGYGELLDGVRTWATQNRVKLTVDYMN